MGIFDRKSKQDALPPLWSAQELQELGQVDYNSVLDYLVGLSDKDYETVLKVSEIYRHANEKANSVLGLPAEPTTFIHPPLPPANAAAEAKGNFLDDEDDIAPFLEDKPKRKPAKKVTRAKVKVND